MLDAILSGCRVLDLTQNVAGPFCTQTLGDLGAEVIKIERPGSGDDARQWKPPEVAGVSTGFVALNRNKKSVCIDLDSAAGQQLVARLAAGTDVLVHSLKPGSAEARGLGDEHLRPTNPRLVYCAISAFGEVGPMRALPGYDPLMQAFTGIMSVSGHEGDEPARVGVSLIDMGTGMWATMAILAALLRRATTGEGMRVHASLLETGLSWMTVPVANYLATQRLPRKMGSAMAMMAPYELFDSADSKVFIAAANDRLFGRICSALACPELEQDPRFIDMSARIGHRKALHAELEARTPAAQHRRLRGGAASGWCALQRDARRGPDAGARTGASGRHAGRAAAAGRTATPDDGPAHQFAGPSRAQRPAAASAGREHRRGVDGAGPACR